MPGSSTSACERSSPSECADQDDDEHTELEDWNLDNFAENVEDGECNRVLTSPRSIEACRMLGIEPEELLPRPFEYFVRSKRNEDDLDFAEKRAARYERMRIVNLHKARAQRDELIEAENGGAHASMSLVTRSLCRSPVAANGKLCLRRVGAGETLATDSAARLQISVLAREQRELERMQQRQMQEVQQMLNFELQMASLQQEREKREAAKRHEDQLTNKERIRRQKLADEARRRKELERAEQEKLGLEELRRVAQQQQLENTRKQQRLKQEEERKRRQTQQAERVRLRRQEEARLHSELNQLAQEREAAQREQEIARREAQQREQRERQKRTKAQELAEKQEHNKLRITRVLEDKEMQRAEQLSAATRKHQESEARRRQFEAERRKREEEVQDAARRKKDTIDLIQQQLSCIEEERRERLREQERQGAAKLQQIELEKQREREKQRRAERRLAEDRRRVYERMEAQQREKQNMYYRKSEQKAIATQAVQEQKHALIRSRLQDARLREEEIQTALTRREKQEAYRAKLLLSRIQSDDERARQLKEQRQNLIRRRQLIKQAASRQKREIVESFYRMKVTKKFELSKHLMQSISGVSELPRSASDLVTRPLEKERQDRSPTNQDVRTRSKPRPASAFTRQQPRSLDDDQAKKIFARRMQQDKFNDAVIDDDPVSDDGGNGEFDLESNKSEIDELRRRQNEELLRILEEEHHAEEQRGFLLRQALDNISEHTRLEKIFDKERASASQRIMELTEHHEEELTARVRQLRTRS